MKKKNIFNLKNLNILNDGINSCTYLLNIKKNKKYILKKYKRENKLKRFNREKFFIDNLTKRNVKNIPKIIYSNKNAKYIILDYIDGCQIKSFFLKNLLDSAKFINKINSPPNNRIKKYKFKAIDACFTVNNHISLIENKIKKIKTIKCSDKNLQLKLKSFIWNKVIPAWNYQKRKIKLAYKNKLNKNIPNEEILLSPSDFGFRNMLKKKNQIYFLDFEYAGIDDGVKLVCDFFLQPDVHVPKKYINLFINKSFNKKTHINYKKRLETVFLSHAIKWCCIILNIFFSPSLNNIDYILKKNALKKSIRYYNFYFKSL